MSGKFYNYTSKARNIKEIENIRNSKIIAFDMDQVITDTLEKMLVTANSNFNLNLELKDLKGKNFWDFFPDTNQRKEMYNLINKKGFFRDLKIMDKDTVDVLKEMNEIYEIFICTAAMEVPNSLEDKYLWLREHLPFLDVNNFVFCGTKKAMYADILIDDTPLQLNRFTGTGVLYTSPFNENEESFLRVNNWEEIGNIFLSYTPLEKPMANFK